MGFFEDLTGKSFGDLRDSLQQGFTGGSFSKGGEAAINAFDPLISKERFGNLANHSVGGGDIFNQKEMGNQSNAANEVGKLWVSNWAGGKVGEWLKGGSTAKDAGSLADSLGNTKTQSIDPSSDYGKFLTQMGDSQGYSADLTSKGSTYGDGFKLADSMNGENWKDPSWKDNLPKQMPGSNSGQQQASPYPQQQYPSVQQHRALATFHIPSDNNAPPTDLSHYKQLYQILQGIGK